jgi:hypothetical protein
VPAAIWRLTIGLTLMFLLGPNVRFGYFIYPFGLIGWLALTRLGRPQAPELEAEAAASVQHVVGDP